MAITAYAVPITSPACSQGNHDACRDARCECYCHDKNRD